MSFGPPDGVPHPSIGGTCSSPGGSLERGVLSAPCAFSVPLAAEIAAARTAAAMSRLARRRRRDDAAGEAALEARPRRDRPPRGPAPARARRSLGDERQDDDGGDGGGDPRGRASRSRTTLRARTSSPASRRRSSPRAARSSACSRSTRPRCRRSRGACGRARLPRRISSATSSTATASSSSSPRAGARRCAGLPEEAALVVNGDDPQVGDLARDARDARRLRARRPAARATGAPARGRLEVLRALRDARTTTRRRTSGTSATTAARAAATRGRRSTSSRGRSSWTGSSARRSTSSRPRATRRVELALPGLYNVYNALAAASLARALGASLDEIAAGLERFSAAFGRFERIAVGDRGCCCCWSRTRRARTRRSGRSSTAAPPAVAVIALNDAIADGRDVSWIWDVDFEPLLGGSSGSSRPAIARRRAGAALQVRRPRPRTRSRSCPTSSARSTAASS